MASIRSWLDTGRSRSIRLHQRVLDTLAAFPGVQSVGGTDDPELSDDDIGSTFSIAGYDAKDDEDMSMEDRRP